MDKSRNEVFMANVMIVHHNWRVEYLERSGISFIRTFLLPWGEKYSWRTDAFQVETLEELYSRYCFITSEFVTESDEQFFTISFEDFKRIHGNLGYTFILNPLSKEQVTIVVKALIKALGWKVVKVRPEGNIFNRVDFRPTDSLYTHVWFCKEVYYWEQLYKVYVDCRDNRCRNYPVVRDIRQGEFYELMKESLQRGHY